MNKSTQISKYCKLHKLKLVKKTVDGFVASNLIDIKAGMEYMPGSGKIISIPIKKIGSKMIYTNFIYQLDGDIQDNGKVNLNY